MFRVVPQPIITSANNCIYSIWYVSHRYCYLPLSWKSWNWSECVLAQSDDLILETFIEICRENQNLLKIGHSPAIYVNTEVHLCIQIRSKDSQVKTQLVLWIFILFTVTM